MNKDLEYHNIKYRVDRIRGLSFGKTSILMDDNNDSMTTSNELGKDIRFLLSKKSLDFTPVIRQLGGQLFYVKSGSTGHTFKSIFPEDEEDKEYAVKVVAYPKKDMYGDLFNSERPENVEILMLRLLSDFVKNKKTPHIVLPIMTFNTDIQTFVDLPKKGLVTNKRYDAFIEKYDNGDFFDKVSILISEWANGGDLMDYIRSNYKKFTLKDWRTMFFQLLSVLAVIQYEYPAFRHNDLKANNILIQKIQKSNKVYRYDIRGDEIVTTFVVPNIGFLIKIWDFDFACIPGIINNNKVDAEWTKAINVNPEQNRYYDVHYFFNTFTSKVFFPQFWEDKRIPQKVKDFVLRIVPEDYREGKKISKKGRLLVNDEYKTPEEILRTDKFFKSFRKD